MALGRPKGSKSPIRREIQERNNKIVAMYFENHTTFEVGARFGISPERVRQIIQQMGYTSNVGKSRVIRETLNSSRFHLLTWREYFISKTGKTTETECWNWTGLIHPNGYGLMSIQSKKYYAHQLAFIYHYRRKPVGVIRHKCDNPACCNPRHLQEGTHQQNIADRHFRRYDEWYTSRWVTNTELTNADVIDIIKSSRNGVSGIKLAKKYNVALQTIYKLLSGKTQKYKKFLESV
jgi:hypothetical protein